MIDLLNYAKLLNEVIINFINYIIGMLYNSQSQAPLECTFSSTGQVSDIETGLFILNEVGDPITITHVEKNLLINEGLIKL